MLVWCDFFLACCQLAHACVGFVDNDVYAAVNYSFVLFPLYRHCKIWPNSKVSFQPSKQVTRYTGPCLRQRRCRRTRTWCVLRCCCLAFCREWYDQGTSPLSFLRKLVLFAEFCIWSSFAIEVRLWVRVGSESFWAGPMKVIRGRFRRGSGLVTYAYT